MNGSGQMMVRMDFYTVEGARVMGCTARVAKTWGARLEGLLRTSASDAGPLLLVDCPSVHTLGMGYPIDVVLIGDGQVLRSERSVRPGHVLRARGTTWVLERPASPEPWPHRGDVVRVGECTKGAWNALIGAVDGEIAEVA